MITFCRLDLNLRILEREEVDVGKTGYMSTYLSMWSNRVRSRGYLGRLLITYLSPSLSFNPLDSLIFFARFHGTLLDVVFWGFAGVWIRTFRQRAVEGGLIISFFQEVFSSFCSFINYSSMREVWYRSRGRWYSFISRNTSKLL